MSAEAAPYLSFVAVSRNDNHGGNMTKRMRLFVAGLIAQTRRHKLPCELVMVEWNPLPDEPPLHEILPKPGPRDCLTIRYITVPNSIHQLYSRGDVIPLFQMIGKNVGIRRATGKFICCTNIDLLFSDALMERLAKRNLDPKKFYRANRVDVPDKFDESWEIEKQLAFCRENEIRRLGKDSRFLKLVNAPDWVNNNVLFAWPLNLLSGLSQALLHDKTKVAFVRLDSDACGDFTLLSREAWLDIQGYLELDLYSIHIDSFGLIAAAARGYTQHVFPRSACTYHIDHPAGWESMHAVEKIKFWEKRPGIGYDLVWDAGLAVMREGRRFDVNPEDWGFAGEEFAEVVFRPS